MRFPRFSGCAYLASRLALASLLAVLFVLTGCDEGSAAAPGEGQTDGAEAGATGSDGGGSGGTLPCAVESVLVRRCQQCHGDPPQFGAPMPLVTYADLQATAPNTTSPVYQVVEQRIHSTSLQMPQPPNPPLDTADMATMDAWVAAGAPQGTACVGDAGAPTDSGSIAVDCTPDTILTPASPWSMPQDLEDQYVCYGIDVDPSSPRQVTAMAPQIDNHTIVHHVVLFQANTSLSSTPAPCNPEADWNMVYIWAPGGSSFTLPSNIGFDEDNPTHWVVQVHYNNIKQLAGQTDSSGFALCTTSDIRPNHAGVAAFGSTSFTIPPHGSLDLSCQSTLPAQTGDLHVFAAMPHMHQLGQSISSEVQASGSSAPTSLDNVPAWNFNNQLWYDIDTTLQPGDTVSTHCAWSNPTNAPVSFGPYTEDEMCYSFLMYYPKIQAKDWLWNTMASTATCTSTY